jgi:hypothetical protein
MAGLLKNLLGGSQAARPTPLADDPDFADFAGAPDPSPASITASIIGDAGSAPNALPTSAPAIPYTKWYRVWERTQPRDFMQEAIIVPLLMIVILINVWGKRANRRRARAWMDAHVDLLQSEFAQVGFGGHARRPDIEDVQASGLAQAVTGEQSLVPEELLKEKSADAYISYASGRQNVAFMDIKISLLKRYNPFARFADWALAFFFDAFPPPEERIEATAYAFDGKEKHLLPDGPNMPNSSYEGFVWGIVHKDLMKRLREDRYDLSLTTTKDHPKLPSWLTIMSESAEITEVLLTNDLLKAVEQAGEDLEGLVVTDQPLDQPKTLADLTPKKRVSLSLRYSGESDGFKNTLPLFRYFLRMPDQLVSSQRFRPEALRRARQTREEEVKKIRKVDESEKAEERKLQADKEKRERRDQMLKGMKAEDQRKFLEKEREKDMRRSQKKKTVKA